MKNKRAKTNNTSASVATEVNNSGHNSQNTRHRGAKKGKHVPYKKNQRGKHRSGNRFKKNYQRKSKCWIEAFRTAQLPGKGQLKGALTIVITRAEIDDNFDYTTREHPFSIISEDLVQNGKEASEDGKDGKIHSDCPTQQNVDVPETSPNENNECNDGNEERCPVISTTTEEISEITELETNQKEKLENVDKPTENSIPLCAHVDVNKKEDNREPFIHVLCSPGARGTTKWSLRQTKDFNNKNVHLPNGDCGDGILNPHPKSKVADKYWAQRKRLFRKYDEGILLDEESWFSVTPEVIADHIAGRMKQLSNRISRAESTGKSTGCIVLDAFCGCGGNAISFAKRPGNEISLVIAVDKDREKLRMAANNASIYGVPTDKIIFIEADAIRLMETYYLAGKLTTSKKCSDGENKGKLSTQNQYISNDPSTELCHGFKIGGFQILPSTIDIIFLSPPWGGPSYIEMGASGFEVSKHIQIESQTCFKEGKMMTELNQSDNVKSSGENEQSGEKKVINGELLLKIASKASKQQNMVLFLPRNINGVSLGRSSLKAGYKGTFEMEQNVMNGKTKTVTAYFGDCIGTLLPL